MKDEGRRNRRHHEARLRFVGIKLVGKLEERAPVFRIPFDSSAINAGGFDGSRTNADFQSAIGLCVFGLSTESDLHGPGGGRRLGDRGCNLAALFREGDGNCGGGGRERVGADLERAGGCRSLRRHRRAESEDVARRHGCRENRLDHEGFGNSGRRFAGTCFILGSTHGKNADAAVEAFRQRRLNGSGLGSGFHQTAPPDGGIPKRSRERISEPGCHLGRFCKVAAEGCGKVCRRTRVRHQKRQGFAGFDFKRPVFNKGLQWVRSRIVGKRKNSGVRCPEEDARGLLGLERYRDGLRAPELFRYGNIDLKALFLRVEKNRNRRFGEAPQELLGRILAADE